MNAAMRLKRHPISMAGRLRHSLVLAYALPSRSLEGLVPPGVELDTHEGFGFLAIAMVEVERLRPSRMPKRLGRDHLLTGYRVFVRQRTRAGRWRRGLHVLRSDADRRLLVAAGNLLTRYNFRLADIRWLQAGDRLEVRVRTPRREADLHVLADLGRAPAPLPIGSPFTSTAAARRFAGPLPWTFDLEPPTGSLVMVHGRRAGWEPRGVAVTVRTCTAFEGFLGGMLGGAEPRLASAFHVEDVDYRWDRGVLVSPGEAS
jgi:uncharacterized protein YqjF (DUF2071 family)